MEINNQRVIDAVIASAIGGEAKLEAARLVEAYLEKLPTFIEIEKGWKVVSVETPFYIQFDPKFYVVGQVDATFEDEQGLLQAEWKTRRAPKLKKDGTNYAGDDEDGWLEEISNGPQLGVYALAGKYGTFITKDSRVEYGIKNPRILVRATIKSNPPEIWPGDYRKGLFAFPGGLLDTVEAALASQAASIRARRKLGVVPWQLPGLHCTNMYRRTCQHHQSVCMQRLTPPAEPVGWHHPSDTQPDPGLAITEILGLDIHDPEVVVLSQSALQTYSQCAEKGRIEYGGYFPAGEAFELEIGTGYHKALSEIYGQVREEQNGSL